MGEGEGEGDGGAVAEVDGEMTEIGVKSITTSLPCLPRPSL